MSENTINGALRRLGYGKDEITGHGFRAMARTILDEVLGERPDFIEHQLAHAVRDPLGRAYNRTKHLHERRRMMQRWADYLDGLKNGAEVVPLGAGRAAQGFHPGRRVRRSATSRVVSPVPISPRRIGQPVALGATVAGRLTCFGPHTPGPWCLVPQGFEAPRLRS